MTGLCNQRPVVVGACGGSGTRVVAALLQSSGFFLGSDLNEPRDNLLAVLLFNRRSVLLDTDEEFGGLLQVFYRYMSGETDFSVDTIQQLENLSRKERHQHSAGFLTERLQHFRKPDNRPAQTGPWGWKMPPSHIFLHRLLKADPTLKYIHVVRHGLDMAFSTNQNQLGTWGPVVLDRAVEITPVESLSYWCEIQSRVRRIAKQYPANILPVKFEELCQNPAGEGSKILEFLDHKAPDATVSDFTDMVKSPGSIGRYKTRDLSIFRPSDLEQLAIEGYQIENSSGKNNHD